MLFFQIKYLKPIYEGTTKMEGVGLTLGMTKIKGSGGVIFKMEGVGLTPGTTKMEGEWGLFLKWGLLLA